MLSLKATLSLLGLCAFSTNAAVVEFWSKPNCEGTSYRTINVYDNTCSTSTGAFGSFKITTAGGSNQNINAYSHNLCDYSNIGDFDAGDTGKCLNTYGEANAMGSASKP